MNAGNVVCGAVPDSRSCVGGGEGRIGRLGVARAAISRLEPVCQSRTACSRAATGDCRAAVVCPSGMGGCKGVAAFACVQQVLVVAVSAGEASRGDLPSRKGARRPRILRGGREGEKRVRVVGDAADPPSRFSVCLLVYLSACFSLECGPFGAVLVCSHHFFSSVTANRVR